MKNTLIFILSGYIFFNVGLTAMVVRTQPECKPYSPTLPVTMLLFLLTPTGIAYLIGKSEN